jgi:hypothetical protein
MSDASMVPTAELKLGDNVWFASGTNGWALVIGIAPDTATRSLELVLAFRDGTTTRHYPSEGTVWRRANVQVAGFQPQNIDRSIEHAQKTLEGLWRKIERLQVLSGLVLAFDAQRAFDTVKES